MPLRLLTALAALGLALAACSSSGGGEGAATAAGAGGAGKAGSQRGGASPAGSGTAAAAAASSTPNPWSTFVRPTGIKPPPGYHDTFFDVVNVSVPEDESWGGKDCIPPRGGSRCTILFRGVAYLAKDDSGTILIQVIEDDNRLPRTLFRMPASKGRTTVYEWVPYTVPEGVRTVFTKAVLLSSKGVPLAESPPQRFSIS